MKQSAQEFGLCIGSAICFQMRKIRKDVKRERGSWKTMKIHCLFSYFNPYLTATISSGQLRHRLEIRQGQTGIQGKDSGCNLRPDQLRRRTMVNSRKILNHPSVSSYKNEKRRQGKRKQVHCSSDCLKSQHTGAGDHEFESACTLFPLPPKKEGKQQHVMF